jgi:hypothetical protein
MPQVSGQRIDFPPAEVRNLMSGEFLLVERGMMKETQSEFACLPGCLHKRIKEEGFLFFMKDHTAACPGGNRETRNKEDRLFIIKCFFS